MCPRRGPPWSASQERRTMNRAKCASASPLCEWWTISIANNFKTRGASRTVQRKGGQSEFAWLLRRGYALESEHSPKPAIPAMSALHFAQPGSLTRCGCLSGISTSLVSSTNSGPAVMAISCLRIPRATSRPARAATGTRLAPPIPALCNLPSYRPCNLQGLKLGTQNGLDLIPRLLAESPNLTIVVITAYATIETAVEAMRRGAWEYLSKPFTPAPSGSYQHGDRLSLRHCLGIDALRMPTNAGRPACSISSTPNATTARPQLATAKRWPPTSWPSSRFARPWGQGACHDLVRYMAVDLGVCTTQDPL